MKTFPVIDSTVSAKPIGLFLQERYALPSGTDCKLFRTGINHSYIVSGPNIKFVFRIYSFNWRSEVEIKEEIRLLEILKENDISISYPIKDVQENYIQEIQAPEGLRYGVLFSYADGKKVRHFTKEISFRIGSQLGKLHQVTENIHLKRVDYNANTLVSLPYQFANIYFSKSNDDMLFIKQAEDALCEIFESADIGQLRNGAVHLDIWYDNIHINGESDLTIFDFDFCGNGWLVLDIAYFTMQMFHCEPDKEVYQIKLEAFLKGYETVAKISAEEKRLLFYSGLAIWIFYLGVQSQRFDNWSNIFLSENYLKRYIGMAKEWLEYNKVAIPGQKLSQ